MSLGPTEILIVALVALVVLGPDKLPQAARTLAKYLAEFRKFSAAVQSQVDDALKLNDPKDKAAEREGEANPANPDISGFKLIDDPASPSTPPQPSNGYDPLERDRAVPDDNAPHERPS